MANSSHFSHIIRQAAPAAASIEGVISTLVRGIWFERRYRRSSQADNLAATTKWPLSIVRSNADDNRHQWVTVRYEGGTVIRILAHNVGRDYEIWEIVRAVVRYRPDRNPTSEKVELVLDQPDLSAIRQAAGWHGFEVEDAPFWGDFPLEEAPFYGSLHQQLAVAAENRRLLEEAAWIEAAREQFADHLATCQDSAIAEALIRAGQDWLPEDGWISKTAADLVPTDY